MAVGTAMLAALLGKYGYVAHQAQNAAVLSIMKHAFTTIPGALWIVTAVVLFFYRLNKKRYNEIVEDLQNVITIALRLIFYMTGIMFSIDKRIGSKNPMLAAFLGKCNPMAFVITSLRNCLLYGETPARKILLIWMVIGVVLSMIGVRMIYKNENSYVKVI